MIASNVAVPPANIGPRSNPTYDAFQGVTDLGGNRKVFAGPRDDPFFVDLGSIFDLGGTPAVQPVHIIPLAAEAGQDGVLNYNTHSIAIQVPKTDLLAAPASDGVIGVYASASRPKIKILRGDGTFDTDGPPGAGLAPREPARERGDHPGREEGLLERFRPEEGRAVPPALPHARSWRGSSISSTARRWRTRSTTNRDDLVAVLLTGVDLPGAANLNFTGDTKADLLRLNTAIPPTASPNPLGVLAPTPDLAGFPNGRRLVDDVTDIELRAVACGYGPAPRRPARPVPILAEQIVSDGVQMNEAGFLSSFPYVAAPNRGYEHTGHR